jgi:MFS family permease
MGRVGTIAGMAQQRDVSAVRRVFLGVTVLRRLPLGILVPLFVRYPMHAGLSLADVGLLFATLTGAVVVCELPTGGLADSWGRRRTLLLAASTGVVSLVLMLAAHSLAGFVAAFAVTGVYWALDSGPLAAWYVDAVLDIEPGRDLTRDFSRAESCEYGAVATGALITSALAVLRLPIDALTAAVAVALAVQVGYLLAVALLLREPPHAQPSTARMSALRTVRAALRTGWHPSVRLLLAVQILSGAGMTTLELLWQPATAARTGGNEWIFGVLGAGGWAAGGVGAALLPAVVRALGGKVVRGVAVSRLCQCLALVPFAVAGTGSAGVVAGYLAFYLAQGPSDAGHATLLHRRVDRAERATLLSLNSLVLRLSGLLTSLGVGTLAARIGTGAAFAGAAVALVAAAPLYLMSGEPSLDPPDTQAFAAAQPVQAEGPTP